MLLTLVNNLGKERLMVKYARAAGNMIIAVCFLGKCDEAATINVSTRSATDWSVRRSAE